jgi:hypothetical protein
MANRICPLCGAEYFAWVDQCASCRVALASTDGEALVDPREAPEEELVVYDFSAWPPDAQADATATLADSGVPHFWEGTDLIIHRSAEQIADQLLDEVEVQHGLEDIGGTGDVEYDLTGWAPAQLAELSLALEAANITPTFEGDLLVIDPAHEEVVDQIFEGFGTSPADVAVDPEAQKLAYEHASSLFLAGDRLSRQPDDEQGLYRLLKTMEVVDVDVAPYGFEAAAWRGIVEAADHLADALTDDGEIDDDDVVAQAEGLRDRLRPFI